MSELSCDTPFIGRNETHDLIRYLSGSWGSIVNETAGQGQSQQDTDVSSQGSARAGAALGWRYRLQEGRRRGPHTHSRYNSF